MTSSVAVRANSLLEDSRRKECDLELLGIYKGDQLRTIIRMLGDYSSP
jgi:hypothetical protein